MNKSDNVPRLCGGTFFVLLRRACNSDTSDISTMKGLMQVYRSDFDPGVGSTFSRYTSEFKNCKPSNNNLFKFNDPFYLNAFNAEVTSDYKAALSKMVPFVQENISNHDKQCWLISALIELIIDDDSIEDNSGFVINPRGCLFFKKDLKQLNTFNLSAFLLGIWHYILVNRSDNTVGRDTFESWHSKADKNSVASFISNIGNDNYSNIIITPVGETKVPRRTPKSYIDIAEKYLSKHPEILSMPLSSISLSGNIDPYFENAQKKYSQIKTLLYIDQPKKFYDFYVCNGLHWSSRLFGRAFPNSLEIENATIHKLVEQVGKQIIITGTGGLGKSMMMRHLLLNAIKNRKDNNLIPILITLKNYNPDKDSLLTFIFNSYATLGGSMPFELFESVLQADDYVFLLDGIDEIKKEYIDQFTTEVESLTDKYPFITIIMSSRPTSSFAPYSRFSVIELSPFTLEQAVSLIEKLDFRSDEPQIKNNFIKELKSGLFESHYDFCSNPLLLTIMLMTYEQFAEIPSKMHLFYHEAYVTLAQRHDAFKVDYQRAFHTGLSSEEFAILFAEFCAITYRDEKYEFSELEMIQYYSKLNYVRNHPVNGTYKDFIYDLVNNICLMYYEGGRYCFTHRSFQEYFCALCFSMQKDRYLRGIGNYFESKDDFGKSERTFFMLYDMIPDKVEEYILFDFIDDLFTTIVHSYQDYLAFQYDQIRYEYGEFSDNSRLINAGSSFILRNFIRIHGLFHKQFENLLPFCEQFVETEYAYVLDRWNEDDFFSRNYTFDDYLQDATYSVEDINSVPYSYKEMFGEPDCAGYDMLLCISDIYDDPDMFQEYIMILEDENFPLYIEYKALREEYESMKSEISKSRQSEDFFEFLN